jgi:integrase
VGVFYDDVTMPDGTFRRVRRSLRLGPVRETTKLQAIQNLHPFLEAVNANALPPLTRKSGRTFAQHMEEWQRLIVPTIKPTTARQALSHLRTHVFPVFGEVPLQSITVKAVQTLVVEMHRKSLSGVTIHHVVRTFHSVLNFAKTWGLVPTIFDKKALSMPKTAKRKESRCFTAMEANRIIAASEEPEATLWTVLALTGCRVGEALALRISDLDFDRKLIRIEQTLDHATREMLAPKSDSSHATVPIPQVLETRLLEFLAKQWRTNDGNLLFCNSKGKPMQRDKVTYHLQATLASLSLEKGSPHGFRHMVASELLNRRVSPIVVQRQLRHSDSKVTMERYAHIVGDAQTDAMNELAGSVLGVPRFGVNSKTWSQGFAN